MLALVCTQNDLAVIIFKRTGTGQGWLVCHRILQLQHWPKGQVQKFDRTWYLLDWKRGRGGRSDVGSGTIAGYIYFFWVRFEIWENENEKWKTRRVLEVLIISGGEKERGGGGGGGGGGRGRTFCKTFWCVYKLIIKNRKDRKRSFFNNKI